MTETVAAWRDVLPDFMPTPHPGWRNTAWLKRNPWFEAEEAELVPVPRRRIKALDRLSGSGEDGRLQSARCIR